MDPLRQLYETQPRSANRKAKILLAGDSGVGKTHLLATCPGPVLLQSFDPNGADTIHGLINAGLVPLEKFIIQDFGQDDPDNPVAYACWRQWLDAILLNGMDLRFNTWCIDSLTFFIYVLTRHIIHTEIRADSGSKDTQERTKYIALRPSLADYGSLGSIVASDMYKVLQARCNVVLTCHVETKAEPIKGTTVVNKNKDVQLGLAKAGIAAPRMIRTLLPPEFSEVWHLVFDGKGNRTINTQATYQFPDAKTRLGAGGRLGQEEPAHIGQLLAKVGLDQEDRCFTMEDLGGDQLANEQVDESNG